MKTAILLTLILFLFSQEVTLFDFDSTETSGRWFIVNDDVMGGVSTSNMAISETGIATFSGVLSPENYGGFASVRAIIENKDITNSKGVQIRLKGDGNTYNIRFRTNSNFDGYAYQAKVTTAKDEWKECNIPFTDFVPTYRGRSLSGKPDLKYEKAVQIGLLIADEQYGKFSLDIDWIKIY
jgi:monofunctional biosynthetic peptidoglycan transglycosylase